MAVTVTPHASAFEKQQRRKLWQAVLLQDTFLTVLLSLPPSATHSDVSVDDLMLGEEEELYDDEDDGYKAVATDSSADVDAEFDDSVTAMATSWNDGLTTTTSPFQQHFSQGQEQHLMTATSMPTSISALRSVLDNYSLSGPPSGAAQTYYPHINAQVQQQQQYQYGHQQQQPTPPPHVMNHVQHQQASVHVHGHHQGPVHVHGHHQHHQLNGPVAAAGHASTVTGPGAVRGANVMTRHYDMDTRATDMAYIRGSWTLANLVQEAICSPRSLDLPICQTARHKTKLVGDFRAVYRSFPDSFRSWDPESLAAMVHGDGNTRGSPGGVNGQHTASSSPPRAPAASQYQSPASPMSILSPTTTMTDQSSGGGGGGGAGKRAVRQMLFLTSNYFHNLMLVHASEHLPDVPVNVRGTLEAAHDAMTAFFMLFALFEGEARVWWVFNHRAFLEALCVAAVLNEVGRDAAGKLNIARDPLFVRARADLRTFLPHPFSTTDLLFLLLCLS